MDSIKDMFAGARFTIPHEIELIKKYVQGGYHMDVEVLVRQKDIVIITGSAGLAASLRLETPKIQKACKTDKKLLFRIV